MKWLRLAICLYVLFEYLDPSHGLVVNQSAAAQTAQIPLVNPNSLQIPNTGVDFNNLILQINGVLAGTLPAGSNNITLATQTTAPFGGPISTVGVSGTSNVALGLSAASNGNIVLFAGDPNSTGTLQFAQQAAFIRANGFTPCPGMATNRPPMLGVSAVVTGFWMVSDWLGSVAAVPVCGAQTQQFSNQQGIGAH